MAEALARQAVAALAAAGATLATAESLTGGMLGEKITGVSGSSAIYRGGVISYCNAVKAAVLGVSAWDLETLGAVSAPVAKQMARGARRVLAADYALSTTGIAGPNSDETGKPVGLVYIACCGPAGCRVRELRLTGDRAAIRQATCHAALQLLLETLA